MADPKSPNQSSPAKNSFGSAEPRPKTPIATITAGARSSTSTAPMSTSVGRFPLYLVRTGDHDGLSAPISFDSIADRVTRYQPDVVVRTNLETAVDFVMALEARELAAFGPRSCSATHLGKFPYLGGINDKIRHELTTLPSFQWVSDEKVDEWGGSKQAAGWCNDLPAGAQWEQRAINSYQAHLHGMEIGRDAYKRGKQDELPDMIFIEETGVGISASLFRTCVEAQISTVTVTPQDPRL